MADQKSQNEEKVNPPQAIDVGGGDVPSGELDAAAPAAAAPNGAQTATRMLFFLLST